MAEATNHSDIKTMSFEKALKELESIVDRLEKGDVELEKISLNQNGEPTGTTPLDVED
jgi:exodeoxyribonuclease VII small subunit